MKKFNINNNIYVKLNPEGVKIFHHQCDDLIKKGSDIKRPMPEINKDGYTKMQMHRFMELFGNKLRMGFDNPVAMDILIDDENLNEVL